MKRLFSAGGVVYKFEEDNLKFLLIATKNKTVWSFPKGIVEKDEDVKSAALREIKEETGIDGKIVDEIGEVSYWFYIDGQKAHKTVKYFLVQYVGGSIEPSWEVDTAEWVTKEEAYKRLTYQTDKEILKKAIDKIYGTNS